MRLKKFDPDLYSEEFPPSVPELVHNLGMCRGKCETCKCVDRILAGCSEVGIIVPAIDPKISWCPINIGMSFPEYTKLRKYLEELPEPNEY